jgi:Asp-tRNA(Asn)/Glu-tRNA(Gln) amidotransferase A subunit family amidase
MSRKKWYNAFITIDRAEGATSSEQPETAETNAAQAVADIAASIAPEPQFSSPVQNPNSFPQIYAAAEIPSPQGGYSILKVADMLQSEHIRNAPPEVKRNSVLVALDAAGVAVKDVIEDAVRRDRALDTYERVQQKALEELEAQKQEDNRQIEAEIERFVSERRARIQANNDAIAKERARVDAWRQQKQEEERRISDAVSYFVTENPITTTQTPAGPALPPPTRS